MGNRTIETDVVLSQVRDLRLVAQRIESYLRPLTIKLINDDSHMASVVRRDLREIQHILHALIARVGEP
jgi:hypothetical protein